jgi:hypothetical protein
MSYGDKEREALREALRALGFDHAEFLHSPEQPCLLVSYNVELDIAVDVKELQPLMARPNATALLASLLVSRMLNAVADAVGRIAAGPTRKVNGEAVDASDVPKCGICLKPFADDTLPGDCDCGEAGRR